MKTIFALLFSFSAFASFAQGQRDYPDHHQANLDYQKARYNNNNNNVNNGYTQRDIQIASINRNIDYRIQGVVNDPYLKDRQKRRAIEILQDQKAQQIQAFTDQYNAGYNRVHSRHKYDRDNHRDNDRDDHNRQYTPNGNWNR